jgi:parallel beta-helix repeat protein
MVTIRSRWRMLGVVASVAALGVAGLLHAGPLDPPVGPIAPTAKPLSEVEPRIAINAANTPGDADSLFKITTPGSYYLTGNITGVANKHGIEIAASGVTVDLSGFAMNGVSGTLSGIVFGDSDAGEAAIRNGTVTGWALSGVDLRQGSNGGCVVESIRSVRNAVHGIAVANRSAVRGCVTNDNTTTGIIAGEHCSISDCVATLGFNGISVAAGSTLDSCIAADNGRDGFVVTGTEGGLTFVNCGASRNVRHGFQIAPANGCTLVACTAFRNGGDGFSVNSGSSIKDCNAHENKQNGFHVGSGCTIIHCSARLNDLDGILASGSCLILENSCIGNGQSTDAGVTGAGIHTVGTDNRIEGNNCDSSDRGIDVDSSGSIIVRNTCSGNGTNYDIGANNRYGPIVNITASGAAAANGNSAASTLTSTEPNANFAY